MTDWQLLGRPPPSTQVCPHPAGYPVFFVVADGVGVILFCSGIRKLNLFDSGYAYYLAAIKAKSAMTPPFCSCNQIHIFFSWIRIPSFFYTAIKICNILALHLYLPSCYFLIQFRNSFGSWIRIHSSFAPVCGFVCFDSLILNLIFSTPGTGSACFCFASKIFG